MLLYTHVVTALKIKDRLECEITDTGDYLLGVVLPDVRYIAGLPREQTHLSIKDFLLLAGKHFPRQQDLVTGYLVHLAADELNHKFMRRRLFTAWPRPLHRYISPGMMSIMLEIAYQQEIFSVSPLGKEAGELGESLGLPSAHITEMVSRADAYLADPCLEQAIKSLAGATIKTNKNIRFYINSGRMISGFGLLKKHITKKVSAVKQEFEETLASNCCKYLSEF